MKFLAICSMKDAASTLPPSLVRPLLEGSMAMLNQQKKAGNILEFYHIPGWNRTVVISENKSAEEAVQNISMVPINALMNFELYPLADLNESAKILIESLKMAEKMMSGPPK